MVELSASEESDGARAYCCFKLNGTEGRPDQGYDEAGNPSVELPSFTAVTDEKPVSRELERRQNDPYS